jgi:hypothetical protein
MVPGPAFHGSRSSERASLRGDAVLQRLLSGLAGALIARGVTPRAFSELARRAFVCAAAANSRFNNGKVNCSRVAARTGLSRTEIRKLLKGLTTDLTRLYPTPLDQVISGWCNDRRFADSAGRPRPLQISRPGVSFATLAKAYAPDIPHRAILEELKISGAVRVLDRTVSLLPRACSRHHNFGFLAPVASTLQRKLNSSGDQRKKTPRTKSQ